jgi:hypothetical protein
MPKSGKQKHQARDMEKARKELVLLQSREAPRRHSEKGKGEAVENRSPAKTDFSAQYLQIRIENNVKNSEEGFSMFHEWVTGKRRARLLTS